MLRFVRGVELACLGFFAVSYIFIGLGENRTEVPTFFDKTVSHRAEIGTNDTLQKDLWALDNSGQTVGNTAGTAGADIGLKQAWGIFDATTTFPVIVGIVDSGIAYNHPDLSTNMWDGTNCADQNGAAFGGCLFGYSFISGSKDSLPVDDSHGTRIAGIIGAVRNNSKGVAGVAPNVKMISVASADDAVSAATGVNFASANGAKIINASWGGYPFDQSLKDAISNFQGLIVFSAGNSASNHDTDKNNFPCDWNLPNAICVAATDQNDNLASFSDFGATTVDIGAPGTNITSTNDDITPFAENFDSVSVNAIPAGFTIKDNGNWGVKNVGGTGGNALFGDLNVPYASSTDSTISAPAVNLSSATAATISFLTACYTKDVPVSSATDHMSLEASADGINFDELKIWNKNTLDNGATPASSSPEVLMNEALPKKYFTDSFVFRFHWFTDSADNTGTDLNGCSVDNISIDGYSDGSDEGYATARSGTSYSAAYVSGVAALLWGYNPNLTTAEVKDLILGTGASLPSLAGKTITGKRVNVFNALNQLSNLPDKNVLSSDISADILILNDAVEGTEPGNYQIGSKAAFTTAINTASTTLASILATKSDVDSAVSDLSSAAGIFASAKIPAATETPDTTPVLDPDPVPTPPAQGNGPPVPISFSSGPASAISAFPPPSEINSNNSDLATSTALVKTEQENSTPIPSKPVNSSSQTQNSPIGGTGGPVFDDIYYQTIALEIISNELKIISLLVK